MFYPRAIQYIHDTFPSIKLIVLLRDPIERAISGYFHQVRAGREKRDIETAFYEEDTLLAPEYERIQSDPTYSSDTYRHFSYIKRGFYADQLKTMHQYISKDNVLCIESKTCFEKPQDALNITCEFLGIPASSKPLTLSRKNQGERSLKNPFGYSKKQVPDSLIQYLKETFKEPNKQLFHQLNIT